MRRSIRFRLTWWYAIALAAGLILFAVAIWISMWHSLRRDVDDALAGRMTSVETFLAEELQDPAVKLPEELREYAEGLPNGTYIDVRSTHGARLFTTNAQFPWPEYRTEGWGRLRWKGQHYRTLIKRISVGGRTWQVSFAETLRSVDELMNRLKWMLFGLIPGVVLMGSLGGVWLSRRALKPVDEITAAARSIGIQDLSQRLAIPQTGDELQRLSETWNGMLARLEDAVSRLSRFTADASHELRTPLAVIRSTAEIAGRRSRSEEAYRTALASIVTESERMTMLVEDLLFLARCDADSLDLPMESLALDEVVEEVCALMRPMADAKGVRLRFEHAGESATILGNRSAIRRLVLILVDNAVKYCRADGTVRIWLEPSTDEIYLRVQDEGYGISAAELPLVFQRFYRGSVYRGNEGFGLGLALASGIAQQHRSKVQVAKTSAEGSVFEVVLPAAKVS